MRREGGDDQKDRQSDEDDLVENVWNENHLAAAVSIDHRAQESLHGAFKVTASLFIITIKPCCSSIFWSKDIKAGGNFAHDNNTANEWLEQWQQL